MKALIVPLFASLCVIIGSLAGEKEPVAISAGLVSPEATEFENIEQLKAAYPKTVSWKEFEYSGRKFVFFGQEMLGFGSPPLVFRGWEYHGGDKDTKGVWRKFMFLELRAVFQAEVIPDTKKGTVSIRCVANTALQGTDVATLDLRARIP